MTIANVHELEEFADYKKVSVGDTLYFVKKISGDVIETQLTDWLPGNKCRVTCSWRENYKFTVNVLENHIVFDTGTQSSRLTYKQWWGVWEPQRHQLLLAYKDKKLR